VTYICHHMQGSPSIVILGIHSRTLDDKQFRDILMTVPSRKMQRSRSPIIIFNIHIRAGIQVLFNCFNVSPHGSFP